MASGCAGTARACWRPCAWARHQTPDPAKPTELHGWAWEHNTRTLGALGYWRLCNRATGFATSDVPDPQDAVGRALVKLRQLLRQATRVGLQGTERAAGVLHAYGWPVEQLGDTSWRLSSPDRVQRVVIDAEGMLRAAGALSTRADQTFDSLAAASAPAG